MDTIVRYIGYGRKNHPLKIKKDKKYKKRTKDNCELCGTALYGEMIFYPNLCLSCVIDYDSRGELRKLRKYEK